MQAPAEVQASIQYLVATSRINRRFWAPGAELNTGVYAPYPVTIRNARLAEETIELDKHGFCLARHRTKVVDFSDATTVTQVYPGEVAAFVRELTGADIVAALGGMMRSAGRTGPGCQPPAGEAHVDFNARSARRIADRLYATAAPDGPGYDRFISFSLWRVLSPAPQDWPLTLCDGRSVAADEGTTNTKVDVDVLPEGDALFAPIVGEEDMVGATIFHHNPAHRWWYFPDMTTDEVIFIKLHDSDHERTWRAPHTAFQDTSRTDAKTRYSYEFRGFAFYSRAGKDCGRMPR
jgi:hypothetical protein